MFRGLLFHPEIASESNLSRVSLGAFLQQRASKLNRSHLVPAQSVCSHSDCLQTVVSFIRVFNSTFWSEVWLIEFAAHRTSISFNIAFRAYAYLTIDMRLVLYLLAALLLLWQEVSSFVPGPRSRIRFGLYVGKSGQSTGKRGANAKSGKASKSGNNAFTKKDSFHGRAGGTKGTGTGAGAKKGSRSSGRGSEDGRSFIVSDSSGDRDLMKGGKMVDKMAKRQESKIQKKADRRDSDKRSEEADAAALRKKMDSGPARNFAEKTVWGQAIINCRTFSIDSPKVSLEELGS